MVDNTYCGFVAIIGRPNVGKSTLMNHLIGQKISITSRKPQTTRHKVSGIYTLGNTQYIFVDTPGFQTRYLSQLNQVLNKSVINSLATVDVIIYVLEAGIFNAGDAEVLKLIPIKAKVILVINKSDQIKDKVQLKGYLAEMKAKYPFKQAVMVAAKHNHGIDDLLIALKPYIPQSIFLYPEGSLTDKSSQFLAAEIIREKLFRYLGEELPYSLLVIIDKFDQAAGLTTIFATIFVNKKNQKPMVIGKGGEKLKKISSESRLDMEKLFACKIYLQVWVKVKTGFADDIKFLQQFD